MLKETAVILTMYSCSFMLVQQGAVTFCLHGTEMLEQLLPYCENGSEGVSAQEVKSLLELLQSCKLILTVAGADSLCLEKKKFCTEQIVLTSRLDHAETQQKL